MESKRRGRRTVRVRPVGLLVVLLTSLLPLAPARAGEQGQVETLASVSDPSCRSDTCHTVWSNDTIGQDMYQIFGFDRRIILQTIWYFGPARTSPDRIELPVVEIREQAGRLSDIDVNIYDADGYRAALHTTLSASQTKRWWPNVVLKFPVTVDVEDSNAAGLTGQGIAFDGTGDNRIIDCGTGTYKDFYGAFQVGSRACAVRYPDISVFAPYVRVRLDSAAPWRFTRCTVHWAYRTSSNGAIQRPPDLDCTQMINEMTCCGVTSITRSRGAAFVRSKYLELWGHVTVRFDHTDWNADDFHYFQTQ